MEPYSIRCLNCEEIFFGREHTCKKYIMTPFTAEVHGENTRLDGSTIELYESSSVEDGTHDQSLLESSTKTISKTKEATSEQVRKEKKPIYQTSIQQNAAFSCSFGVSSVQQQSGDSREGLSLTEPEQQKHNPSVAPTFQEDEQSHFTYRDVAYFHSMSTNLSESNSLSSASPSDMDASAGPSHGFSITDPRDSFDAKVYRRKEDRQFECPFCGKSFPHKAGFLNHYRTHTGEKPYSCDMCGHKCRTSGNMEEHRRTHTGEKPYICPFCERPFSTTSNCKKHIKIVHFKK